ncbi:MAG: DNA recombination protein RmuC [Saprospiraceae bacterium]|nr:DNA recombination protein RmuC [Saprospiraceae bacterium]
MPESITYAILFLLLGLLLGMLIGMLITRYYWRKRSILREEVITQYIEKNIYQELRQQVDLMRDDLVEKEQEIRALSMNLSAKDQNILHLDDKLRQQKIELEALQKQARLEFEHIANRILEEKSQRFTHQNKVQLGHLLQPLQDKIKQFEAGIEKRFLEETRDRVSLKKEIEQLRDLNHQLSEDANNLAMALKGDNKSAGDWGEIQLEAILEKAGLQKDIHYHVQSSFRDEAGQLKRPDFIINLPGKKHLVIDSKVSLKAYEKAYSANDHQKKAEWISQHLDSIRRHIKDLSTKNYQDLYQINSPDYLLLFVPIEPAFSMAIQQDHNLFAEALDKNIVIVTTSTLLATMRTVSFIWKQEKQKKSVLEIARQSGLLYDKFCGFVDDLQKIGHRLDQSQSAYHDAMRKLTHSTKKGDTLIGRAEKIRELGARASKKLPQDLLEESQENESQE